MNKYILGLISAAAVFAFSFFPAFAAADEEPEEVTTQAVSDGTESLEETESEEPETEEVTEQEASEQETDAEPSTEAVSEEETVEIADPETGNWNIIYPEAEIGSLTESVMTSGLVEVYLGYAFSDGSYDIWYSAPGFSVNENTVLTTDGMRLKDPQDESYQMILSERMNGYRNLDIDLSDYETVSKSLEYRIYCGGILIPAGILGSDSGVLVLDVSGKLSGSYVFSNENAAFDDDLIAVGVLDRIIKNNDLMRQTNILEQSVEILSISADGTISFSIGSHEYFIGGPLLSETGAVLGIVTSTGDGKGESIPADRLESLLNRLNREYATGDKRRESDYSTLKETVLRAEAVDREIFTEDSLITLDAAMQPAYDLLNTADRFLDQTVIDKTGNDLEAALSGLVEVEKKSFVVPFIIIGSVLFILSGGAVVFVILRKRKPKEEDYEYLTDKRSKTRKTFDELLAKFRSKPEKKPAREKGKHVKTIDKKTAPVEEEDAATVLFEDEEDTATVLIEDTPVKVLRTTTGEVIEIPTFPYIFGHSEKFANYVLQEKTISRKHFMIDKAKDGTLIIRDLHSTNGTSLNGIKIDPEKPEALSKEDIIVIPGEEFRIVEDAS